MFCVLHFMFHVFIDDRHNVLRSPMGFRQADQELALAARIVNHPRVGREARKLHEAPLIFLVGLHIKSFR
jgi:hypothetical protein